MGEIRETKTKEKHEDILNEYYKAISELNHLEIQSKKLGSRVSKSTIWEVVAERSKCSVDHAQRVVRTLLKRKTVQQE